MLHFGHIVFCNLPVFFLQFEYKGTNFNFGLVKTEQMSPSVQIRVDGREMDSQLISKQLPLYRGAIFRDDVYIHCNILLTDDGIDGIVKFGNETITIEPLKNQEKKSLNGDCTETFCKRLKVYPCIVYRPEDLIDKGTHTSYVLGKNDIISSQYSEVLRKKRVKLRVKRSTEYTECKLHIVADHKFYQQEGNSDTISTVSKMMYFVTEANILWRSHDFDGDGNNDNVGVSVKKITVYTTNSYTMHGHTDSFTYLEKFAEYDFNDVCLGAAFTSKSMQGGTIGLAYKSNSNPLSNAGGICARSYPPYLPLNENVLFVTTVGMYNQRLPTYESVITLAHELGHSFGSSHDASGPCLPGGSQGNYIMDPWSHDGSKPNNRKFSSCSIAEIYPVILAKGTCLKKTTEVCGNAIKEDHEECDCGKTSICDLIDPSCTPSDTSNSNPDPPCTVRRNGVTTSTTTTPPSTTTNPPPPPSTTTNPPPSTTTNPPPPPSTTTNPPPSTTTNPPPPPSTTTNPPPPPSTATNPAPILTTNPPPSLTTNSPLSPTTNPPLSPTNPPLSPTNPAQRPTTNPPPSLTKLPCQCSSVYSPCCTAECQFAPSGKPCRFAGECVRPTNCSGTSGDCPHITFEPDKKLCNNNRRTCLSGRCIGSVCSYFNSTECDCDPGSFECHVCCLTEDNQCLPAMINNITYITKLVGSSCNQRQGFCDEHLNCDLEGGYMDFILIGHMGKVFSPKAVNELGEWFQVYWYYVVAGLAGLLFIAAVFFATCRQRLDVNTSAFMYGQFMRIKREAEIQKQYIKARKKLVELEHRSKMENVEQRSKQMGLTKAVARMKEFFPTTPDQELQKVLKICSKEEMAVYLILMKGFPLRRLRLASE